MRKFVLAVFNTRSGENTIVGVTAATAHNAAITALIRTAPEDYPDNEDTWNNAPPTYYEVVEQAKEYDLIMSGIIEIKIELNG